MSPLLAGALLGISLAAPPGPVMAVVATAASRGRTRESLLTCFGAITADGLWLTLVTAGFLAYLGRHTRAVGALGLGGAALLIWMAYKAWSAARVANYDSPLVGSYKLGFLTVLTSPFSFAWWMGNGAILLATWGWQGVAGLFSTLILYSFLFTWAFAWLGTRFRHTALLLAYVSVVMLAGFGVQVGVASVRLLTGP
jgi:threonine/homoserine/homoserine lactone efflux protein